MKSQIGQLISIQTGTVQRHLMHDNIRLDFHHPFWTSAIFKSPITGPVHVSKLGIAGDEQADLENHGGPDNAVLAYDASHFPIWQKELNAPDIGPGSFLARISPSPD